MTDTEIIRQALRGMIPGVDRQAAYDALARIEEKTNRATRILGLVKEALSQLRLDVKYLTFDLEATRQERDELRQKYEN